MVPIRLILEVLGLYVASAALPCLESVCPLAMVAYT